MTLRFTLQALTGASALLIGGHLFDDAKGAEKKHRAAYYKDGEIHVNILGAPDQLAPELALRSLPQLAPHLGF